MSLYAWMASASDDLDGEVMHHFFMRLFYICTSGLVTLSFPWAATLALWRGTSSTVVGTLARC
jgi:hypothetical protein